MVASPAASPRCGVDRAQGFYCSKCFPRPDHQCRPAPRHSLDPLISPQFGPLPITRPGPCGWRLGLLAPSFSMPDSEAPLGHSLAWPGLACLGRVELIGKVSEFTIALGEPVRVRALSQSSQMSRSRYEPGRGREGWWRVVIACGLSRAKAPFHEGSAAGCHGKQGIFMIYI